MRDRHSVRHVQESRCEQRRVQGEQWNLYLNAELTRACELTGLIDTRKLTKRSFGAVKGRNIESSSTAALLVLKKSNSELVT